MKVSLLNFFVTPEGLEDQLLGTVVTQVSTACAALPCKTQQMSPFPRVHDVPCSWRSCKTCQERVTVFPSCVTGLQERPDLANLKSALVVSNAKMKAELAALEGRILSLLSASSGNILDDEELINTLAQAKVRRLPKDIAGTCCGWIAV